MILAVSWRNIWRNKLRSLVILSAIALGITAGIFSWAFYHGMVVQRVQSAIITEKSHIQLHAVNYLSDPELNYLIPNTDKVEQQISLQEDVKAVSARILVQAMATSAENGSGVQIVGINPEKEKRVTNISQRLIVGEYFGETKGKTIVIGNKLAEKLKIKLRSKLVLTFQDKSGELIRTQFRVGGIYKTSNSMFDEMNVFVRSSDLFPLIGISSTDAHEITILLFENEALENTKSKLISMFPKQDTKTWKELMPEVSYIEQTMDIYMYFFLIIILAALGFGIINTMLMAVLERIKELGMLMAIGMSRLRVFAMIMTETILLSLTGGALGLLFGYLLSLAFAHTGVDLSAFGEAYATLGYDSIIFPITKYYMFSTVTIMVVVTGFLASVFPALKAIRLNPAEALRTE